MALAVIIESFEGSSEPRNDVWEPTVFQVLTFFVRERQCWHARVFGGEPSPRSECATRSLLLWPDWIEATDPPAASDRIAARVIEPIGSFPEQTLRLKLVYDSYHHFTIVHSTI
jgi:hypothetical protein